MTSNYFEKNNTIFCIEDLSVEHFSSNYLYLLKQLTNIDVEKISKKDFSKFVENLSKSHIIKIIKIKDTSYIVATVTILIENKIIHNFGKVGHIEDVVVEQSMRGLGIGKEIIEIAKKECKECYKIILDCHNENIKFYENCGFKLKGNEMAIYM